MLFDLRLRNSNIDHDVSNNNNYHYYCCCLLLYYVRFDHLPSIMSEDSFFHFLNVFSLSPLFPVLWFTLASSSKNFLLVLIGKILHISIHLSEHFSLSYIFPSCHICLDSDGLLSPMELVKVRILFVVLPGSTLLNYPKIAIRNFVSWWRFS